MTRDELARIAENAGIRFTRTTARGPRGGPCPVCCKADDFEIRQGESGPYPHCYHGCPQGELLGALGRASPISTALATNHS